MPSRSAVSVLPAKNLEDESGGIRAAATTDGGKDHQAEMNGSDPSSTGSPSEN
jgi:hypothetical protein